MTRTPTARENILRKLKYLGLDEEIEIDCVEVDRVFGWPKEGDRILKFVCIEQGWPKDPTFVSEYFHSTPAAYRERGVTFAALQIAFHWYGEGVYALELDHDLANPHRFPWGTIGHALESLGMRTVKGKRRKTNQAKIAAIMDSQGIPA